MNSSARITVVLTVLFCASLPLRADEAETATPSTAPNIIVTESDAPVTVYCTDFSKGWLQLAKTLRAFPNARHIIVQYENEWEDSVLSMHFTAYQREKWFYNPRYETVDYDVDSYGVGISFSGRALYQKVTKSLLIEYLAQNENRVASKKSRGEDYLFDKFATENGIRKLEYETK